MVDANSRLCVGCAHAFHAGAPIRVGPRDPVVSDLVPIVCAPTVNSINDSTQHVALETACQHTLHMWRVQEHSILVVAVDNKVDREEYMPHVLDALEIIEQGEFFFAF